MAHIDALTPDERDIADSLIYGIAKHIEDSQGGGMPEDWLLSSAGSYSKNPDEDAAYRVLEYGVLKRLVEWGYITEHNGRYGIGDNVRVRSDVVYDTE